VAARRKESRTEAADAVRWRTWREALGLFLRGVTAHVAWRIALPVGTILTLVNQGGVILAGEATTMTWIRTGTNYCVPFCVSSLGWLAARRVARNGDA
jgi:hypothetical protein